MENVQGLHYRTKDGPTMQFWPAHQHEFFQGPAFNGAPQSAHLDARSRVDEPASLHNLPVSWDHITRLDGQNGDAAGSKNWLHDWEWNSLRLTGHLTTNGSNVNTHQYGHTQWGQTDFSSPSPLDNLEENGAPGEPTLLEFGLTSRVAAANEDDGLLDLKLGGNIPSSGAGEVSPSLKRSRQSPPEHQQTRCQVDNCSADLQNAKDYHRRHKVCELHAKAPKALVGNSMQRFCQQCSRFHLLKEFDEDRRSCRKRLAGHNRRRRKNQPDAAATLACLLAADQSLFAKIIGSSGQQQDLESLLQGNQLVQSLWNARAAVENKAVESALPNNLINAISKSQLLGSLLLSNSTLAQIAPVPAPAPAPAPTPASATAEALISALSSALLASLPQLQQKITADAGGSVPIQETGQLQEPKVNNASGSHAPTKQNAYSRYSVEEQSGGLAFPSSMERQPRLPTTSPVYSDKSNDSNGDSTDERFRFDSCQGGSREGLDQEDRRHWKARKKGHDDTMVLHPVGRNLHTVGTNHTRSSLHALTDMHAFPSGDPFETTGGVSDHSSDSGLDKPQEQTASLWFKIFDKNPSDLPSSLRNQIIEWLDHLPTDMEGYIKPGCIILTIFVCMPVYAWEKLCRNIERSLQKLVSVSDGDFWCRGRVFAQFGEASAFIIDGVVYPNIDFKPRQIPTLFLVQPFAIVVGEAVNLILRGNDLKTPGTKFICANEGKCVYKEMDLPSDVQDKKRDRHGTSGQSPVEPGVQQEQVVTFNVGPFNNMGRSIIEVEGESFRGSAFPIIIADKSVSEEVNLLERIYIESHKNNGQSARTSFSATEADITHFLHELGWLLQRGQRKADYIDLKIAEFSIARYRWLLRFSVEHCFCAVVRRVLDILFSTDNTSFEHARSRALDVLVDANLLHVAVKNKLRAMVEFLMAYTPPGGGSSVEREYFFRPDVPVCDGFTPLHVAASMRSADDILDALTDFPEELWVTAWTSAKDAFGQTPLMYALKSGNDGYVKMVQAKLQKLGKAKVNTFQEASMKPPHVALNIGGEDVKLTTTSSPRKLPFTKQMQNCTCKAREARLHQNLPLQIHGLNKGFRPFVVSMLAVAAVCVCVGVLMRGAPSISCLPGPFVWDYIRFGYI